MSKKASAIVAERVGKPAIYVQVTTGADIQGHEKLIEYVETEVRDVLSRFAHQIMSVEVHFTDENGEKSGSPDKRCLMEARCSGRPPVAVSDENRTIEGCFLGSLKKMQRLLESSLRKVESHKGAETIRKENLIERKNMSTEHL